MLGALPVSEISCERKARLLLLSSQASPPSSKHSFHSTLFHFTASTVALRLSTTVRPSLSTSIPPHLHTRGQHQLFGSLMLWPKAWPNGLPLAFIVLPAARNSSQVCGERGAPGARPASPAGSR